MKRETVGEALERINPKAEEEQQQDQAPVIEDLIPSLRDRVMIGVMPILANPSVMSGLLASSNALTPETFYRAIAKEAYLLADTILAERDRDDDDDNRGNVDQRSTLVTP